MKRFLHWLASLFVFRPRSARVELEAMMQANPLPADPPAEPVTVAMTPERAVERAAETERREIELALLSNRALELSRQRDPRAVRRARGARKYAR